MPAPFEEPAKVALRASCEIAIDQAGHILVADPVSVALPDAPAINGRLKGDLQSLDGVGRRYHYFLRPKTGDTLPQWLANLGRATHSLPGHEMLVVVREASPEFELACRVAGCGLLRINDDNEFQVLVNFNEAVPEAIQEEFAEKIGALRRKLEDRVELNRKDLESRFARIGDLTRGMPASTADTYVANVERQYTIWRDWGDKQSAALDDARTKGDAAGLAAIEEAISAGPVLDDDVEAS